MERSTIRVYVEDQYLEAAAHHVQRFEVNFKTLLILKILISFEDNEQVENKRYKM